MAKEFKKDEYTVGRDASCGLVINDSHLNKVDFNFVSQKHFKISHKKDGVYLEGLALTYVNDKKINPAEKTILKHNDRIAIGKMHLKVFVYLDKKECDKASRDLPDSISNKYLKAYSLGQGGFGEVSLIFEKNTGKMFAMKTVKKNPKLLRYAYTEKDILQKIRHPCVIDTEGVEDTPSFLFIVLEFMEGGDLSRRVHPVKLLEESHIKLIFFQLVQAIQYLHQQNIVHRDIKPENILLASKASETLIKVADFGVSKILRPGTQMDTHVGTPYYQAPEILDTPHQAYTKQVDIWSMGILLYFCLSSKFPFDIRDKVKRDVKFPQQCWTSITSTVTDLIRRMLKYDPKERIDLNMILSHPWLKDNIMRRKAHHLMWPGKPYVDDRPSPALLQRGGSLRQTPRGVLQHMPSNYNWTVRSPNRPQPGMSSRGQLQMKPAANVPSPNAVKVSAPNAGSPGRPVNAAREPYKPSVRPAAQYAMQAGRPYAAGVRYEPAKPVKDAIQKFERK